MSLLSKRRLKMEANSDIVEERQRTRYMQNSSSKIKAFAERGLSGVQT